jgi:hypothetical protein
MYFILKKKKKKAIEIKSLVVVAQSSKQEPWCFASEV